MSNRRDENPLGSQFGLTAAYAALWAVPDQGPPDVFAFLREHPETSETEQLDVLLFDQRRRWSAGYGLPVEDYVANHPDLGRNADMLSAMIHGELSARRENGDAIDIEAFAARFPSVWDELLGQISRGDVARLAETLDLHHARDASLEHVGRTQTFEPRDDESAFPTQVDATRDADLGRSSSILSGGQLGFSLADDPDTRNDGDSESLGLASELSRSVRFEIHQPPIGKGGMGIVYQAFDRERGDLVALKTMKRIEPITLYRFKNEFRTLADLSHRNLVNLYELIAVGDLWFFTMELIRGVDFVRYVQGTGLEGVVAPEPAPWRPDQTSRLNDALRQLALGLSALHNAGKLHRDVKPTNVLVTREGRVVLLDFGVSADLRRAQSPVSGEDRVVGTVGYMAPEMSTGRATTPASDWYSVGVMLYYALTNRLPFEIAPGESIAFDDKPPPSPCLLRQGIPVQLSTLCMSLLSADPERRPDGRTILAMLGEVSIAGSSVIPAASASWPHDTSWPLVGRERHRALLEGAFGTVLEGRSVLMLISGRSGSGKSMLIQTFLADLVTNEDAIVLEGRCHERESVPYKALDSVIDALSRYLKALPKQEAESLLPEGVGLLARMFPVLKRVEALAEASMRDREAVDAREMRRKAVEALRELLRRIGSAKPLVIAIDDLHWGDLDNAFLFRELLAPDDPPALLLIVSYREEDIEGSPLIQAIREAFPVSRPDGPHAVDEVPVVRELNVGPLTYAESRRLALALLEGRDASALADAHVVAKESGGNPYFIDELVKSIAGGGLLSSRGLNEGRRALDSLLRKRIESLPEEPRRLLHVIAVSGRPVCLQEACEAAELKGDSRAALAVLRSARLVRGTSSKHRDEVDSYHECVRDSARSCLDENEAKQLHLRLARALEDSGQTDPETIGSHLHAAGQDDRAAAFYLKGADLAMESLAFGHASKLYALVLKLREGRLDVGDGPTRVRLGDALANAGRGREAAEAYLKASESVGPARSLDLKRKAAVQLLLSGHFGEGFALIKTGLQARGLKLPATPASAVRSLIRRRAWLRLRGLGFRPRDASEISPDRLALIDLCWSAGAGLSNIDPVRGADFQTRGLMLALGAGEPYRVARALTLEAATIAFAGASAIKRAGAMIDRAEVISNAYPNPHLQGLISLGRGITALMSGEWREADEWFSAAEPVLRDRCNGMIWELDTLRNLKLWARIHTGDLNEVRRVWPGLVKEASDRGDLHALTNYGTYAATILHLADDQPDRAEHELRETMARWSGQGFHLHHSAALRALAAVHLYRGDGQTAFQEVLANWTPYSDSLLPRIQMIRVQHWTLRAQAALLAAADSSDPERYVTDAERMVQLLSKENVGWANAHARLVSAGLKSLIGGRLAVAEAYTAASIALERAGMRLSAAAALRRAGESRGTVDGRPDVERSDEVFRSQAVKFPSKFARIFSPVSHFGDETTPSRPPLRRNH